MHGQVLTESIRFKATLEVNAARVDEELGSKSFKVPAYEWIKRMRRHEMKGSGTELCKVTRFSDSMKL